MPGGARMAKLAALELRTGCAMTIVTPTEPNTEPLRTTLRIEAGAAQPVAPAATPEERSLLERELDRVQHALQDEQVAFGQQLNWLMLSQALFLNAYLIVLVLGWSTPLQGKRLLLGGLALFAAMVAVLVHLALRGGRDALHALRTQRRELEDSLHRRFGRTPVFQPVNIVTRGLGAFAVRLLPASFIAGWVAISLYTLAAPISSKASEETAAPPAAAPARTAPRAAPANRPPASPAAEPSTSNATIENGVAEPTNPAPPRRTGFKW
jgi:hypothetical protein